MYKRMKYHFEPKKGWMNDPNGLVYYKGKFHIFFQHNPYDNKWGKMHWGHAISDDLIHFEELDIALFPDENYENSGGCFSGSAIVKDDVLYLFYTSVSNELGQTISMAYSNDGLNFTKYEKNPLILPKEKDFRDPKVEYINGVYYMVVGSGNEGIGKVFLFKSNDLFNWKYHSTLVEGKEFGSVMECPDFFYLDGKYVLMYSNIETRKVYFLCGTFINEKFEIVKISSPEEGPDFYAPQTFLYDNRRIMIGWMYNWEKTTSLDYAGALSIPRELSLVDDTVYNFPIKEARHLLIDAEDNKVLKDTRTEEVFICGGKKSITTYTNE